jgi:hypothetical protein
VYLSLKENSVIVIISQVATVDTLEKPHFVIFRILINQMQSHDICGTLSQVTALCPVFDFFFFASKRQITHAAKPTYPIPHTDGRNT